MSWCSENVLMWRVTLLLILGLSGVYIYLYTTASRNYQTGGIYKVVEGDLQAIWSDKVGHISYFLKLMQEPEIRLELEISASANSSLSTNDKPTANTTNPLTKATTKKVITVADQLDELKKDILANKTDPLLVMFTTWGYSKEKELLRNLTIINWLLLRPFVVPVIFTNDSAIADEGRKVGWKILPIIKSAADGIPVLKYMYRDAMEVFNATFYAFGNGDILFTHTLIETLFMIKNSGIDLKKPTLMVGKRTNVNNVSKAEGSTWESITKTAQTKGQLFTGYAEDYFIVSRLYPWYDMPEVVIGRIAYDNFLVYFALLKQYQMIDISITCLAVHQTTKAGNFEGHSHANRNYNHNLLVKMYGRRIRYNAGTVECAVRFTKRDGEKIIYGTRGVGRNCRV